MVGDRIRPLGRNWAIARETAIGLGIALLGIGPWAIFAPLNARYRPDLPWAAALALVLLALLAWWLAGGGPPSASRLQRWRDLRLWTADDRLPGGRRWPEAALLTLAIILLTVLWIGLTRMRPAPDLSDYPTAVFLVSAFVMTPIVAGVAEEMAFRGYLLSRLERFGPGLAIVVTSSAFALAHVTHGIETLLMLGPGFFIISVLYCLLVRATGSILPAMALHTLGDFAYLYFGVLRGHPDFLFGAG